MDGLQIPPSQFVNPANVAFCCVRCRLLALDPHKQPNCEHLLCKRCVLNLGSNNDNNNVRCPACPQNVASFPRSQINPSRVYQLAINEIYVKCPFGHCNRTTTAPNLHQHVMTCPEKPTGCPFPNSNHKHLSFPNRLLSQHLKTCEFRPVVCVCGAHLTAKQLAKHQRADCTKTKLCSRGCGAAVLNDDVEKHITEQCPKVLVWCKFSGCGFEAPRGDSAKWKEHERLHSSRNMQNQGTVPNPSVGICGGSSPVAGPSVSPVAGPSVSPVAGEANHTEDCPLSGFSLDNNCDSLSTAAHRNNNQQQQEPQTGSKTTQQKSQQRAACGGARSCLVRWENRSHAMFLLFLMFCSGGVYVLFWVLGWLLG